ncbi:MAG: PadR family transcriptional regulator [Candidatus Lokiarchaeota archaeon]|nr:PadR family transcriptional regulator [Candidatus Lokiarchaeota archaeon]
MYFPKRNEIRSPVELIVLLTLKDGPLTRTAIMERIKENFNTWDPKEGTIFPVLKRLSGDAGNRFEKDEQPLIIFSNKTSKSKETFSLSPTGEKFLRENLDLFMSLIQYNDELFKFGFQFYKDNNSFLLAELIRFKNLLEIHSDILELYNSKEFRSFTEFLNNFEDKIKEELAQDEFVPVKIK